ncbi:MAG TPA: class I poly(R)-hydroxyalkanoic acid synthase [Casimicrobiaceae bacterium]|nr:class I poly(R)-hydroxyalkanoic acid synthase [Casimicrobiaceae bacterium]
MSTPTLAALPAAVINPQRFAEATSRYQAGTRALWDAFLEWHPGAALPDIIVPDEGDRRFRSPLWRASPFHSLILQSYLLHARYLGELVAGATLSPVEKRRLAFMTRQYVDALSPSNFPATNPDVVAEAFKSEGASLVRGAANFVADLSRGRITTSDERAFHVGRNIATTPGAVVFRNELIELIQYAPTTARVHALPLVIVPPSINKYYVLDLSESNSFVRYTIAQGYTTFIISWRNIPPELGRLTWDDYLERGVIDALRVARKIAREEKVNALGFCVGGTLLASALAVLAARGDDSVTSATFLTTMLDFDDPGEIGVYVTNEFLAAREGALMAGQRMHGAELAGAFSTLRANDLVWNYVVGNYLKGETPPAFDLLYWNGDSANLPGPMFAYYLREMYLANRLREPGALTMAGEPIDLHKLTMPSYVLATRDDHIVPWKSAFRTTQLLGGEVTFALGASGHIAGVVNPAGSNKRNYWIEGRSTDPDQWLAGARSVTGSWWPHWSAWLETLAGAHVKARDTLGSVKYPLLESAPGRYVVEQVA